MRVDMRGTVVLRRHLVLVVAANDDGDRVRLELDPVTTVGIGLVGTDGEGVPTILSDGEVTVVDITAQRAGHTAIVGTTVERERRVALALDPPGHPVLP